MTKDLIQTHPYHHLSAASAHYQQALDPGRRKLHISSARFYGGDWYHLVCHTMEKKSDNEIHLDVFIHRLEDRDIVTLLNIEFNVIAKLFHDPSDHWEGKSFTAFINSELGQQKSVDFYIHRIKRIFLSRPF